MKEMAFKLQECANQINLMKANKESRHLEWSASFQREASSNDDEEVKEDAKPD